jgi:hypothetical protein
MTSGNEKADKITAKKEKNAEERLIVQAGHQPLVMGVADRT